MLDDVSSGPRGARSHLAAIGRYFLEGLFQLTSIPREHLQQDVDSRVHQADVSVLRPLAIRFVA